MQFPIENGTYSKKRRYMGRKPDFEDTEIKIVGSVLPNVGQKDNYILRDPNKINLDNIPIFSEHSVSYNFPSFLICQSASIFLTFPFFIGEHRESRY